MLIKDYLYDLFGLVTLTNAFETFLIYEMKRIATVHRKIKYHYAFLRIMILLRTRIFNANIVKTTVRSK